MGRVGLPELIVILVIVVIIFGANRLPQLGQGVGSAIKNFKNAIGDPDAASPTSPTSQTSTQLTCRNCAKVNPAGSRFCGNCGNKL